MKLLRRQHEGRAPRLKAVDVLATEAEPEVVDSPAREKLLKEWDELKRGVMEWPAWRYIAEDPDVKNDPGPFEHYMELLMIVAAVAPEKIPEIREAIGLKPWEQLKAYFESKMEGHITRSDMWITHAVGARILFPDQASQIVRMFRPQMKRMFEIKNYFTHEDGIGPFLVKTYLADPEFPGLQELINEKLPILRKSLLAQLNSNEHATGVVHKAAFLFLLSPQDRDMYQERVMEYLEQNKADIDLDFKSGKMDRHFAGYFIKEPWYSAVVCQEAKLKDGQLVFERDQSVSRPNPLPMREAI